MAKTSKIHFIASTHRDRTTIWSGTLEDLKTRVFGYTLECGNSWNHKIPKDPKTIKTLVKALNDSAYECNKYYDHYEIAEPGTFDEAKVMHAV
jgi:hypothetical protein